MKFWQLLGSIVLAASIVGCAGNDAQVESSGQGALVEKSVTGSVTYRERIALPDNALISIVLADASVPGESAKILSQIIFPAAGKQPPYNFSLPYTASQLQGLTRAMVSASIEMDGRTVYSNNRLYEVLTNGKESIDVVVERHVVGE